MAILCTVAPLNADTMARALIGFSDSDDERLTALGDETFYPGISRAPTLNREGWNGDWNNGVFLPQAAVNLNLLALKDADPASPAYRYTGAPFLIYRGEPGDPWESFELLFDGLVLNSTVDDGTLKLTAQVNSDPFEEKVLSSEYDGFGGPGGGPDLKERMKPALFGNAENVEPVTLDVVNNVYQVHGYGPIQAIRFLYERGVNYGPALADYPTYADLVAATVPEGKWATCLAQGMFRMGAPPFGLITVDVSGDNTGGFHQTTAAIIRRLCAIAGVDPARLDDASLDAFEAEVPYPINLYVTAPDKLIDEIAQLVLPCNAHASLSWLGKLQVTRFATVPVPSLRFDVQGRELPPVLESAEQAVSAPFYRLEMQYGRSWRVQTKDELNLEENLTEVPKTIWRAYPDQPPTPTGDEVPPGWFDFKPEMTRPVLTDDGRLLFGPTWESHSTQKGGVVSEVGWSAPRLDDSRYKGFVIQGRVDSDLVLGGADSIRVDGIGVSDCRFIPQPIGGPFRLRCYIKDGDTRAGLGVMFSDPAARGGSLAIGDIHTGVAIAPTVTAFGLPQVGVYPFTNSQLDGGYTSNPEWNRTHSAVPSYSEYLLISNGELIDLYINRELARTFVVDRTTLGDKCWPVFYLEGWDQSYGSDSDIFNIEWTHGTPARILDYPISLFTGALRRMTSAEGFEINAPFMPALEGAGIIEAKSFKGGGRVEARYSSASIIEGASTSVITLKSGSSNVGRVELDGNGHYRVKVGGTTYKSGTWVDGDTWTIIYEGRYVSIYLNGTLLKRATVSGTKTVSPRLEFAQYGRFYDIFIEPKNQAAYSFKGSVLASSFTSPLTDASPQTATGYSIVGTTADLAYAPADPDGGNELRVTATFHYYWPAGGVYTAPFYLPDTKVELSYDAGSSWTDLPGTWAPSPAPGAYQGGATVAPLVFTPNAPVSITAAGTVRARLVAKNTQTGTYSVTVNPVSYVMVDWVA